LILCGAQVYIKALMEERIKLLINKYLDGNLTEEESRELSDLAASNDQVWQELLRIQEDGVVPETRRQKEQAEARKALAQIEEQIRADQVKKMRVTMRTWLPRVAAAGILAAVGLFWLLRTGKVETPDSSAAANNLAWQTTTTQRGGQFPVTLPDGTRVTLNSVSSLHYPANFPSDKREVELTGEAYFEVARDAHRPFRVMVNGLVVNVLGTSFNVRSFEPGKYTIAVTEGSVKVTAHGKEQILAKQEQLAVRAEKWTMTHGKGMEDDAISWMVTGQIKFVRNPLSEILPQLERWYDVDVENRALIDPVVPLKIHRNEPLSDIVNDLQTKESRIHCRMDGRKLIITSVN
jgi:ferric-dicitrate binding protein FerR (iron transport regulator)